MAMFNGNTALIFPRCKKHDVPLDFDECEICARERRAREAADDALAILEDVRKVLEGYVSSAVMSRLEILEGELREMEVEA